jgi:hypothetical protein
LSGSTFARSAGCDQGIGPHSTRRSGLRGNRNLLYLNEHLDPAGANLREGQCELTSEPEWIVFRSLRFCCTWRLLAIAIGATVAVAGVIDRSLSGLFGLRTARLVFVGIQAPLGAHSDPSTGTSRVFERVA